MWVGDNDEKEEEATCNDAAISQQAIVQPESEAQNYEAVVVEYVQ